MRELLAQGGRYAEMWALQQQATWSGAARSLMQLAWPEGPIMPHGNQMA
jgi:hypothetical protein